jgi:signal transduction histidine kinase
MAEKLLLVDDEEGIRKVLGISLKDAGYLVWTAGSGEEALQVFRSESPALVLTDIKMPGMDGIELLQVIKRECPDTEVIMLTGHGDLELAIRSLQFEAADFITKPISDESLEIALKRAHDRMWMRRRLQEYTESLETMVQEKTQQLLQAERLAAIGETVATLAHAIKNIIGGLSGGMYVLEKGMELSNQQYLTQGWEMLKGNVGKIKNLALDLLNYAKDREPNYEYCNPNDPVKDVFNLMFIRAREVGVNLKMELDPDLDYTWLDPEGIHNCLLNLVTNAIDACTDIECVNQPHEVTLQSRRIGDRSLQFEISDNGCGMDEETSARVFTSFFSTKGTRGTGLGLMITKKIVNEHGGSIELNSCCGQGTTITITLPRQGDVPVMKGR